MTRKYPAIFAVLLLVACCASAPCFAVPDNQLPPEIERILALPEDKIDVGEAALIFAREVFPDQIDVIGYSREIDRLADETRELMPPHAGTDAAMLALSGVIYNREGFHYDFSGTSPLATSLDPADKAEDYYLPAILQLRHGTCVTLPMLFLAVAQRLGLPIYPSSAPQHTFLRITDPNARIRNWEATSGGPARDVWIIEQNFVPAAAIASGTYMRTWSYHEYLAELLTINGNYYQRNGNYVRAIKYFERALQINPAYDYALVSLQGVYTNRFFHRAKSVDPSAAWDDLAKAQYYGDRIVALGAAPAAYEGMYPDNLSQHEGDNRHEEFLSTKAE